MKKILSLAILAISMNATAANQMSIENLNQKLQKAGATWVAKDTWLNHLSQAELVRMMGARDVNPSGIEFSTQKSTLAPEVFDWRNRNGINYISPMLNQGNCGSCVAFAAVGTLESQMNIVSLVPGLNPKYSTEALFACGGGSCDYGWWPSSAAAYLQRVGVPDEACAPYTMGATGKDVACSSICSNSANRSQKISAIIKPSDVDAVKAALKNGPMVTTMQVYADFVVYSSGVYKHTTGARLGGHAISLVGFDDTKNAWIIRNSWGPDWGMGGFGYVSYDDISGVGESNTQYQISSNRNYLRSDLADRSFVSGTTELKVSAISTDKGPFNMEVTGPSGKISSAPVCNGSDCVLRLETANLEDGMYQLSATKGEANLNRYFYVANRPNAFQLTMSPNQFDPNKTVTGRIEFNIDIGSNSKVPLKRVALAIQDSQGKINYRWSENIANQMSLGWRTPLVANGRYTVWIVGESISGGQTTQVASSKLNLNIVN